MKKIILYCALVGLVTLGLTGCQETAAGPGPTKALEVNIAGLKGPTSMGMIQLMAEDLPRLQGYTPVYTAYGAPDDLTGKIISGEVQIAAVPTNLASVLYHKTQGKIQLLGINTLGVIHLVGSEPLADFTALKGKTLHLSGKGATPDYAVNYLLETLGIRDEVTLEFFPDHPSLAQAVIAGDATYAVLPEPFVTQVLSKSGDARLLIDLNTLWEEVTGGQSLLTMGGLIVNTQFAEDHPDFLAAFLADYRKSVEFVNTSPAEAGELIAAHGILPEAGLAAAAIPNCAIVLQDAKEAREAVEGFLKILMDSNPNAVGGKLPDENFYYQP